MVLSPPWGQTWGPGHGCCQLPPSHWPAPYTGRLLRNRHAETWLGRENELEARMEEVGREYAAAREHGDFNVAGVIAGESCALIHDIPPAGEIVERVRG